MKDLYLADLLVWLAIALGGHPDSEMYQSYLITVAGQRWTCTKLSPLLLMAVSH